MSVSHADRLSNRPLGRTLQVLSPICLWLALNAWPLPALPESVEGPGDRPEAPAAGPLRLSGEQLTRSGIRIETAGPGELTTTLSLPGQLTLNTDRLAHVVPRAAGVVREVRKRLGDQARSGEVLAVIESRELADARAAYLAARERATLARATFRRKETLWKENITSSQIYEEAKQALALAEVEEHTAEQKLLAIGLSQDELSRLARRPLRTVQPQDALGRYEISAPFAGTVLERHITLGEAVEANSSIFLIGDLSTVWVDLNLYPKDLPLVHIGQTVAIVAGEGGLETRGRIIHVQPVLNEATRRSFARAELDNRDGHWQPGLFVTGHLQTGKIEVPVRVGRSALQNLNGETVVFVASAEGLRPRPVKLGQSDEGHVEIVGGLSPGQRYAETGSLILKGELQKGEEAHEP